MEKVIVITGPTGVGKTKISLEIAKKLNTEIINGDAYQIYKKMNIGTAKPEAWEQEIVPHKMIDICVPKEPFSVYEYKKMAELILPYSDTVILTEPHSERKLDVFSLARSISDHEGAIYTEKEIEAAFEKAVSITPKEGIILCCGSLYMIGAMRTYIKSKK